MNLPDITVGPGYFRYEWLEESLRIDIDRIRDTDEGLWCDLIILDTGTNHANVIYSDRFNMLSGRTRVSTANILIKDEPRFDWRTILMQVCEGTKRRLREGEPLREYGNDDVIDDGQWLIRPFCPLNLPGAIYGEWGIGKSELSRAIAIAAQLNYSGFGFEPTRQCNVLVEDWEMEWHSWARQLAKLEAGMMLPETPRILYDHPKRSLPNEISRIHRLAVENNIGLTIIDSQIPACGGDPNKAEDTEAFFAALKLLPGSKLIICQTSKERIKGRQKTIYGNAMWTYESRSTCELLGSQVPGEDSINLGVFHRKCNVDKKYEPMGFTITFDDLVGTRIENTKLMEIPEMQAELPAPKRIEDLLKHGSLKAKDIAEELELSLNYTKVTLNRMAKRKQIISPERGLWGLPYG